MADIAADCRYYNSDKYELSYLEMPKSASTSIRTALMGTQHVKPDDRPEFPVFTFVRDPLDRFVSGWHELVRGNNARNIDNPDDFAWYCMSQGFYNRHILPQHRFIMKAHREGVKKIKVFTLMSLEYFASEVLGEDIQFLNESADRLHLQDVEVVNRLMSGPFMMDIGLIKSAKRNDNELLIS